MIGVTKVLERGETISTVDDLGQSSMRYFVGLIKDCGKVELVHETPRESGLHTYDFTRGNFSLNEKTKNDVEKSARRRGVDERRRKAITNIG